MAIPRRFIVLAASAAAGAALWYVAQRARKGQENQRSAVDDANAEKDKLTKEKEEQQKSAGDGQQQAQQPGGTTPAADGTDGAKKELALFLAGDAWHDEIGWQALWEKDGVAAPDTWLKDSGRQVLTAERQKLTDHPALLAGCRRRWIVVCRYAGIDVGDAAAVWNDA